MATIAWNREMIEKLIVMFQQEDCLYNLSSEEYVDRTKKTLAYNRLLLELKKFSADLTVDDIKKKIKTLRTQFMRENRLVQQSRTGGGGGGGGNNDATYIPKLWCYDQLTFLSQYSFMRINTNPETLITIETAANSSSSRASSFVDEEYGDEVPQKKVARKNFSARTFKEKLEGIRELIRKRAMARRYGWLGDLVSSQMDDVAPEDRINAAWEVQCIMRKYIEQAQNKPTNEVANIVGVEILANEADAG